MADTATTPEVTIVPANEASWDSRRPQEGDDMADYARVVTFEADDAALEALLGDIKGEDGPPEGVPAKRITVLADRAAGTVVVAVRFGSEEDLRRGAEVLEAMSPPDLGSIRRVSVDAYEVVFERELS
jgi:hypothetical protein